MINILQEFASTEVNNNNLSQVFNQIPLVLSIVILDKSIISKNAELKPFANMIGDTVYREYLFHSRTALFARLVKDVFITTDDDDKKDTIIRLQKVIPKIEITLENSGDNNSAISNVTSTQKKSRSISKKESAIKKWQKIIEGK